MQNPLESNEQSTGSGIVFVAGLQGVLDALRVAATEFGLDQFRDELRAVTRTLDNLGCDQMEALYQAILRARPAASLIDRPYYDLCAVLAVETIRAICREQEGTALVRVPRDTDDVPF